MPELPEVETVKNGLNQHCHKQVICSTQIYRPTLRWPIAKEILNLKDVPFPKAIRRSKYLIIPFSSGQMIIHLGMSGVLRIEASEQPRRKHDHVEWHFTNGQCLRFNDTRRFGAVLWTPLKLEDLQQYKLLSNLGPEPLSEDFNATYLLRRCQNRKTPIKTFIMNSTIVVGVGNIYANEALFMARILPERLAASLSQSECVSLVKSIKYILEQAIRVGGTTIKDFAQSNGKPGYFTSKLNVYGRANQPCTECQSTLSSTRINNRQTVYCAQCQK